jgi:hypothetical protein
MLTTTKEMAYEGKRMNHCVATYVGNVERGQSGIYTIDDHTLELRKEWDGETHTSVLVINQLRGYSNADAPRGLIIEVKRKLWEFNYKKQSNEDFSEWSEDITEEEIFELPF